MVLILSDDRDARRVAGLLGALTGAYLSWELAYKSISAQSAEDLNRGQRSTRLHREPAFRGVWAKTVFTILGKL